MKRVPFSFVVKVLASRRADAQAVAACIEPALAARRASARVTTEERPTDGIVAQVGVIADDGSPHWIAPLASSGTAQEAASDVVAFLERWGFMRRGMAAR